MKKSLHFIFSRKGTYTTTDSLIAGKAGARFVSILKSLPSDIPKKLLLLGSPAERELPRDAICVLLGGEGIRKFIPSNRVSTLDDMRGNIYEVDGRTFLPTYHPQEAFDQKYYREEGEIEQAESGKAESTAELKSKSKTKHSTWGFWLYQDIKKAGRLAVLLSSEKEKIERIKDTPVVYDINKATETLKAAKGKRLIIDIETNANYSITVLSFMELSGACYVVELLNHQNALPWRTAQILEFFRALSKSFACETNTWIAHNGSFDFFILAWRYRIVPPVKIYDTMVAQHRTYTEIGKSLGHCISMYLYEEFHKDEGIFKPRNHQQYKKLCEYNAKDTISTALVYKAQREAQEKDEKLRDSVERGCSFVRPYLLLSLYGINVNQEYLAAEIDRHERLLIQHRKVANMLAGYEINMNSPQQVSFYLFEGLEVKPPAKDPTSSLSLYRILGKENIPLIRLILRYRSVAKELGYLKMVLFRGRFVTSYNVCGTDTYRMSSSQLLKTRVSTYNPATDRHKTEELGWGGNGQNIKPAIKKIFCPSAENLCFVSVDQAGAEAYIMAYVMKPGRYRRLFECGIKPHTYLALHTFKSVWIKETELTPEVFDMRFGSLDIEPEDLIQDSEWSALNNLVKSSDAWLGKRYYFIGKKIAHAYTYGMKWLTFIDAILKETEGSVVISVPEAKRFLALCGHIFPEIAIYQSTIRKIGETHRTLYNLFGDRRRFYEAHVNYRSMYSYIAQSTIGVLNSMVLRDLQLCIERGKAPKGMNILNNIHDSIGVEVPKESRLDAAKLIKECFQAYELKTRNGSFRMKVEALTGDKNLKELEEMEI